MKKKMKILISILAFCLVFGFFFYVVDTTLKFKYDDGIRPMMDFYEYPDNSVDVLFLGSSHIGVNIDTVQLCDEYGIASYKLWGTVQPVWNAWFYLVEALKTQSPEVVVLETLALTHDIEYSDYSASVKNTLGMKFSWNKIQAITASVSPEYRKDVYTGFATYHTRYNALEEQDFESYFWNYQFKSKNTRNWYAVWVGEEPSDTKETLPMGEKASLYFEKIVNLCKEKGIELVLVTVPYSIQDEEKSRLNTVKEYAEENGITYLDYMTDYKEVGIDFSTDFGDSAGHLNSYGIEKITGAVGKYLRENYDLPLRYYDPWFAYEIPSDAIFYLSEPFQGDGETQLLDTGIYLYDDPSYSWTLLSEIDTQCDSDEKIYFSCFDENEPYHGLLVRKAEENQLDIIVGNNYYCKADLPNSPSATLAIVKNGSVYQIYLDGTMIHDGIDSVCDSYDGTLTIGSQRLPDNRIGKLSKVGVKALEIREGAMEEEDILTWMEEHEYTPTKEEIETSLEEQYTGELNYVLEESFKGNGEDAFLDTGVQLYCEPERSWRLSAKIAIEEEEDGVYFSCFSEDAQNYRGLLVRKTGELLQILVGNGQQLQQKILDTSDMSIVIEKKKAKYQVYVNEQLLGSIEADCDPYPASLLLGCEMDEEYQPFRFSTLEVKELEIREEE